MTKVIITSVFIGSMLHSVAVPCACVAYTAPLQGIGVTMVGREPAELQVQAAAMVNLALLARGVSPDTPASPVKSALPVSPGPPVWTGTPDIWASTA